MRPGPAMRRYMRNSPQAVARLLALGVLVDGQVHDLELDMLDRAQAWRRLGVTRHEFVAVLQDLCADLMAHRCAEALELDAVTLRSLFDEVGSPALQGQIVGLLFDLMHADGHLHPNESRMWRAALHHWRVPTDELLMALTWPIVPPLRPHRRAASHPHHHHA